MATLVSFLEIEEVPNDLSSAGAVWIAGKLVGFSTAPCVAEALNRDLVNDLPLTSGDSSFDHWVFSEF